MCLQAWGLHASSLLACATPMSTETPRHYGPAAIGGDVRRFAELTLTLARTEFKLRYFGSVLGYVWSLMRPLLFFGVIYFFFVKILRIAKGPHYGVYLLTALVLWAYFGEATITSVKCLVAREQLLRKIRFPRLAVPLSVSLTALFNLGVSFIVVIGFALADGITPTVRWLELIPIVLGFLVLATGFGMLLSALYVKYRDVDPIWDVALQAWFYASPVIYTAAAYGTLSPGFQHVAMISPPATLLTQMGHAFIDPSYYPAAVTVANGWPPVIAAIAIIFVVFALGWWVFTREAPRVAENL
jgi:ABC-2 type transport system permease protein